MYKEPFIEEADRILKLAGHVLYVTYPLVKDSRLFISIMNNIDKALKIGLDSLLYHERIHKRISPYPDHFATKLDIFRRVVSRRYNFNKEIPNFILDVDQTVKNRKAAPVEFTRRNDFVICDPNYRVKVLRYDELKDYFSKAKVFILQASNIINNGVYG